MAVAIICLYVFTPFVSASMMWLRYVLFIGLYAVWVIGYTFQTSVTRAAQAVLTNDPKQRPLFTIFNTVGSLAGMGAMQFVDPILAGGGFFGDYNQSWVVAMPPIGVAVSVMRYVAVAFVCGIGVLALLLLWKPGDPTWNLSAYEVTLFGEGFKLSINLYTILFILFFGIGYGAYYATADMPIPMCAWALTLWAMKAITDDTVKSGPA